MKVLMNTNYGNYNYTNFRGGKVSEKALQNAVKSLENANTLFNSEYKTNREIISNALYKMAREGKTDAEMAIALGKPANWFSFISEMKEMYDTAGNIRGHYMIQRGQAVRREEGIYKDLGYNEAEIAEVMRDPVGFYRKKFAAS